mgnify:CR=1 FL=1
MSAATRAAKDAGALVLRGDVYKPRTSPYAFQGLGLEGLRILRAVGDEVDLPITTELMDVRDLDDVVEHVDITSYDARPIIDSMRKMSFSSRDTARAADIFNMALEDQDCSPWLILAGSTSAGGCMHVYRDMVKFGQLILNKGRWQGEQLIPEAYLARALTPSASHPACPSLFNTSMLRSKMSDASG